MKASGLKTVFLVRPLQIPELLPEPVMCTDLAALFLIVCLFPYPYNVLLI